MAPVLNHVRLLVATEARLFRARDERIYTDGLYGRRFFDRYLTVFDEVRVLARVGSSDLPEPPGAASLVEDERVRVHPLPDYRGALGTARHGGEVARLARGAVDGTDAAMLRAPGYVAQAAHRALLGRPYGVEVVGDPEEVFRRGASRHPARAMIRRSTTGTLRRMTEHATVVGYVSSVVLPERYPAPRARAVATYSSVSLTPECFLVPRAEPRPVRALVTVTSLEQPYKGVDVLLRALTRLPDDVTLTVVGDGRLRAELVAMARALGLAERVTFTGNLPGPAAVREVLAASDAFVLASRTEGLPRAMLEAMAAGLPCVGTDVGGIPELLPAAARCRPGDAVGLAALVDGLIRDPAAAMRQAWALQDKARGYAADQLQRRRNLLLTALRAEVGGRR
ncbi:hypothetical protein GCM10022237_18760 [Nocardioides ginsengisoli]|uniref:Glycosyltransferase n=1 Tax=Nocardioides ginsengisoli TaxID=363868 RepID=A0ABW3W5I2_9ACTN